MPDTQYIQVVTTVDDAGTAASMARSAVESRLAACAQVGGPVTSTYRWQGAVEEAQEWVVTFKTTRSRYDDLQRHIRVRHPYDVAEILALPILAGDPAYLSWISDETT